MDENSKLNEEKQNKEPEYRTIYVTEPSKHDLSLLYDYGKMIKFLCAGYEPYPTLLETIESNLESFDPEKDMIVPIGRVVATFLIGIALGNIGVKGEISMAFFKDQEYHFLKVNIA